MEKSPGVQTRGRRVRLPHGPQAGVRPTANMVKEEERGRGVQSGTALLNAWQHNF